MDQFLLEIFSFPTIIFTLPLIFFAMFWLIAIIGLIDIDIFDVGLDAGEPDSDTSEGTNASWLEHIGLGGVPLTISLALLDFYSWIFSLLGKKYLTFLFDDVITGAASGSIVALVSVLLAIPISALCIKPLRTMFTTHETSRKSDLTGLVCVLTTSKVTGSFGQATSEDGSMIINVRAKEPNEMNKGDKLILLGYDEIHDSYEVVLENELFKQ